MNTLKEIYLTWSRFIRFDRVIIRLGRDITGRTVINLNKFIFNVNLLKARC